VDPGWLRSAVVGAAATAADLHIKHTPRLLKEAPEIADEVKAGRAKLPKRGADWYHFWKKRMKEAAAAATEPSATETESTSPIEDVLEKVSEPKPTETEGSEPSTALVVAGAGEDKSEIVLAGLERVRGLLAEIATVPQAKEALAAAKAVEIYARATKASTDILRLAFGFKSLAKRRLGEMVVKMKEAGELDGHGGDRKSKSPAGTLKLKDLGISKKESVRAQEFASVSEPEFERILDEAGGGELSDAALLRRIRAAKANNKSSDAKGKSSLGVTSEVPPRAETEGRDKPSDDGGNSNNGPGSNPSGGESSAADGAAIPGRSAGNVSLAIQAAGVEKEFARVVALWRRVTRWGEGRRKLEQLWRLVSDAERTLHELAVAAAREAP